MKRFLTILCLIICYNANALSITYYVSNSGNDANNGTSTGTAWRTLTKVNSFTFGANDQVLFNRGETFSGFLIVTHSGSSGNPISYGAYGTGANPIITGLTTITAWTNLGANIWESTSAVSTLSTCKMVVISGVNIPMGRFPNSGWLTYQSHISNTSITSSSLNSAVTNWTGAEAIFRTIPWMVERNVITGHSGGTINVISANVGINGNGLFIQNDVRTLDAQNEWYYNPGTKKIRVYSTSTPSGVQVASVDNLVLNSSANYITYDHIDFLGANTSVFENRNSRNVIIQNCTIAYAGVDGVFLNNAVSSNEQMVINSNNFHDCNNNTMEFLTYGSNVLVQNNTITNSGMILGAGLYSSTADQRLGVTQDCIVLKGAGSIAEYNNINGVGHSGIYMIHSDNIIARYNLVQNWGNTRYDGGGIYSYNIASDTPGVSARTIDHNITLNSNQTISGLVATRTPGIFGIYLDGSSINTAVTNNTTSNCFSEGIHILNSGKGTYSNNTCYNNIGSQFALYHAFLPGGMPTTRIVMKNNIFFSKTAAQFTFFLRDDDNAHFTTFGTSDSNYFARPIDDNLSIRTAIVDVNTSRNLAQWKTFSGKDAASKKSPVTISNVSQLDFEYNATNAPAVKSLPAGTWIDVRGTTYNTGSITLAAYSSAVLINTGTNLAPVANAGTNKNITLPTTSVTQVGSGTDADGTIVSYLWLAYSGPTTPTFGTSTSSTTMINGLSVPGVYVVQIRVTDNLGLTATDTATIIVNASPPVNVPPTANAGGNKNITLPTNSVTQVGSGTDTDGSVISYNWTQVSGPTATIVSSTSATTVINNLLPGVSVFQLEVTDNLGAKGSATASITVNTAANVNPTANAGIDQSKTWPVNNATVTGTGNDTDGSIVSYNWTKISGPGANITNPSSASTTITGMQSGAVYQFRLLVTDNSGGTGSDVMQITVAKGSASSSFSNLSQVHTGAPLLPTLTTSPAGLPTSITLDGITGGRINAGSYSAIGGITDTNYISSPVAATFTITKQVVVINASNKTVNFDGNPQTITATTTPSVTGLSATYTGISGTVYPTSATPPSAIGTYRVDFILTNSNFQATPVNATLTIVSNPAIIFISDTTKVYNGSSQNVTVTSAYSYSITYNPATHVNANSYTVIVNINDGIHTGTDTAIMTIAQAPSPLSWPQISNKPFGSQITAGDLNASSSVAGTFTYDHAAGEIPPLGTTFIIATFLPADNINYQGGTITNSVNVYGVNPFINFIVSPSGEIFFIEQ